MRAHTRVAEKWGSVEGLKKPKWCSLPNWIKTNTAELFNQIETLYDNISVQCTSESCPTMTAGSRYEFLWAEGEYTKPTSMPAREYIINLALWAEDLIFNENIFPEDDTQPSDEFFDICDKIWRRLIRVLYHIYHHHLDFVKENSLTNNLNRLTLHYCMFSLEYKLINDPAQYDPIRSLLDRLLPTEKINELQQIRKKMSKRTSRRRRREGNLTTRIDITLEEEDEDVGEN